MILGTKSNQLPILPGSIPDEQLILVPDPATGELKRSTFGQAKADIILAIGDLSYLDDIIEVPTIADLPQPGQIKKIYVITTGPDANKQFRWGGTIYIEFPQGSGDVAAEAVIRGNADTNLQANIDAESAARAASDATLQTNINNEAAARQNADTTLQNNLSAEANTRATNDSILQGMINTEASIRANADNDIDTRLDALESAGPGGSSLPTGGTSGQLLQKNSSTDDDASWSSTIPDEVTSLNADVANLESAVTTLTTDFANIKQSHFLGVFLTLAALQAAHPSPVAGDYADIDAGTGTDTLRYIYDVNDDNWVTAGAGTPLSAAQVKTLYESNANTNAYTDAEKTKLSGIEAGAQANDPNTTTQGNTFNAANKLVQLDASAKLPAVDGSQLTNLPSGGTPRMTATGTNTYIVTNTPAVTAYPKAIYMDFQNANTGASTVKIDALAPLPLKIGGGELPPNTVLANSRKLLTRSPDGSHYQVQAGNIDVPAVPTGEKVLTKTVDGIHTDYDIFDELAATSTTGANLSAQNWTAGNSVAFTGKPGEKRYYGNYLYICTSTNIWWRVQLNLLDLPLRLGTVNDSGGVKTSVQMVSLFPDAIYPQYVLGNNGRYIYEGSGVWHYNSNDIAV